MYEQSKKLKRDKRFENLYLLPAAQTRDKNAVTVEQMNDYNPLNFAHRKIR